MRSAWCSSSYFLTFNRPVLHRHIMKPHKPMRSEVVEEKNSLKENTSDDM